MYEIEKFLDRLCEFVENILDKIFEMFESEDK